MAPFDSGDLKQKSTGTVLHLYLPQLGSCLGDRKALYGALDAFRQYLEVALQASLKPRRDYFEALPAEDRQLLMTAPFCYLEKLAAVKDAITVNTRIASAILENGLRIFNLKNGPSEEWHGTASPFDRDIARATVRHMYRDWSEEGDAERSACHNAILQGLANEMPQASRRANARVLVPGAGLARLMYSISQAGFKVEGNELSYHLLLASACILGRSASDPRMDLYPWALSFSNHVERSHQLQKILIPDIAVGMPVRTTTTLGPSLNGVDHNRVKHHGVDHNGTDRDRADHHAVDNFCLTTGDFSQIYTQDTYTETFDAVTTCFFIDTAPNLLRYIRAVHNCLRKGSIWINIGPLLWNSEENGPGGRLEGDTDDHEACQARMRDRPGVVGCKLEFTAEEVVLLLEAAGFTVEVREDYKGDCGYIMDPRSMLQNIYRVTHWVARK